MPSRLAASSVECLPSPSHLVFLVFLALVFENQRLPGDALPPDVFPRDLLPADGRPVEGLPVAARPRGGGPHDAGPRDCRRETAVRVDAPVEPEAAPPERLPVAERGQRARESG